MKLDPKSMGCSKSRSKRDIYESIFGIRKISNKQFNLIPKETRRTGTTQS